MTGTCPASPLADGTAWSRMWAGRPIRSPRAGNVRTAPRSSAWNGGPVSGWIEVQRARIPPRVRAWTGSPPGGGGGPPPREPPDPPPPPEDPRQHVARAQAHHPPAHVLDRVVDRLV